MDAVRESAMRSKDASFAMQGLSRESRDQALHAVAQGLVADADGIVAANLEDMAEAERQGLSKVLIKRLSYDHAKIEESVRSIHSLMAQEDPVGRLLASTELDTGLVLEKVTCPIGVIAVIFESRPDALVQISTLCLKSGNAVLLKGGSEAAQTNQILAEIIARAAEAAGMPAGWIHLLETRQDVAEMLALDEQINLVIPRGSNEFVRYIMNSTNIPVLGHADGICHVYVDADADLDMAVRVTVDSKCQYVAVCNAAETLLVDADVAPAFLPQVKTTLEACHCRLKGCERTRAIIPIEPATDQDWATEYLDYVLSIRVVDGLDAAIDHINRYGSGHTDTIITADREKAERFMNLVDSADVFWNASTRFSDGYRYGLGAEVGISTNKIHARGPVGLEGLAIYKWKLYGKGQVVADYSGPNARKFTHKKFR